jgi:hypothetical protein
MFGCYCFFDVDAFLDNYSYFDHSFRQSSQWARGQQSTTSKKLKKDEEQIKQLNNPEQIEKICSWKVLHEKDSEIFTS